uniref:Uncharacterized protein n=1 Tax=Bracon brevicornis TaxID=1563983 RepID=A0A6V7LPD5_9HYME
MHSAIVLVIVCVIGAGTASPVRKQRSLDPFWHLPCGEAIQAGVVTPENLREEIATTIESLKLQHQLTLTDYLSRDYDFLYERVRLGVHRHQYITNWIPGKKDVNAIKSLSGQDAQIVSTDEKLIKIFFSQALRKLDTYKSGVLKQ